MGRWRRDAQDVVDDLVSLRNSGNEATGFGELTLSAEGQSLCANSSLLLAASPFLRRNLIKKESGSCWYGPKAVLVLIVGVTFTALENVVRYLYGEEVAIEDEDEASRFIDAAKALEISGIVGLINKNENETILVEEQEKKNSTLIKDDCERTTGPDPDENLCLETENAVHAKSKAEEANTTCTTEQRLSLKYTSSVLAEKKWIRPVTPPKKSSLFGSGNKKFTRQMTLPSMAKRRAMKDEALVDLTHSEDFNGGMRKMKNCSGSMLPPAPPPTKRKSEELDVSSGSGKDNRPENNLSLNSSSEADDDFKANSQSDLFDPDDTMFISPHTSPMVIPGVSKRNRWEHSETVSDEEVSKEEKLDVVNELEKLSPVIVRRKPLSPLNKSETELRHSKAPGSSTNVKKKLFSAEKEVGAVSSTQQLLKNFNKMPEKVKEDRGEKCRATKEEKARMEGWSCVDCENYYKGLESQMHPREVERLRQLCSKHRKEKDFQPAPDTPPDFWNTSMPSTDEAYRTGLLRVLPESYEDSFFLND